MRNLLVHSLLVGVMAVVTSGIASPTQASSFIQLDVPALSQRSESVVQGRVTHMESAWNASRTMVYTYVTLEVSQTLKGPARQTIEVRVPGGRVDGFIVRAVGTAHFHMNQDVLAFISRWSDGTPRVTGYHQGLSQVVRDIRGTMHLRGGAANGSTIAQLAKQLKPERGEQP